ncbi:response regulator transcription factor [Leptolyngbya sp. FACHB-16]|uniref:response regulator transcription factor n=1 Tax=unclassified Leptolyngbya TaxID=2650499 RepID=UPI001684A3B4|nr:response regulator transcription factor [Leptolyngbya sp. FACHB-16]MBD2153695.1 response regulator transcription factor [Leptolyngbya sp. FACHB-16]
MSEAGSTTDQPKKILVVDDHDLILNGTIVLIQREYPDAKIVTEKSAQNVLETIATLQPDLVVLDLFLPPTPTEAAQSDTGIQLIKEILARYPTLNIAIQSSRPNVLVRIKSDIDKHMGGFTVIDKAISGEDMILRVKWALQGVTHTRELRHGKGIDVKPEWLPILNLAFQEGLQDKEIARRMNLAERTVRNYWNKLQDALGVYPDEHKNLRIATEIRAREEGLID